MSLVLAIALNLIAASALLAGLAYVMTRPARLRPHAQLNARVIRLHAVPRRADSDRRAA
jgi:hypothetical protein